MNNIIVQYQVTLFCATKKYKPVSCIIEYPQSNYDDLAGDPSISKELIKKGITKICFKRGWDKQDLVRYGYTKCKIRKYDKTQIEKENEIRYERIKEEKYASGEWKRPKTEK